MKLDTKARLAIAMIALCGGLAGCATSLDMGPGYYHYDWRLAGTAPVITYREPVAYKERVVLVEPVRDESTTVR
jgi:hypothetical protein